jgi:hypothetical protein
MFDRDLYTADGREWFEPRPHELVETKEKDLTVKTYHACTSCNGIISPHKTARFALERKRTWTQTGAISGRFSEWGPWRVVGVECLRHDGAIPF